MLPRWRVLFVLLFLVLPRLPAAEIVFASYNVENYLRMDRREKGRTVTDAPKPEREIAAIVQVLGEIRPDILGLMEMGDEATLTDLQARLKAAGLDLPYREWVRGADEVRHLALLSRFPLTARNSVDDVSFELNGKIERMPRGILDVTVSPAPGYELRLLGAHLKSRRPVPDYDESRLRAKEAVYLRDYLEKILQASPTTNLLLFGDLNDTKNEYPIRQLIGTPGRIDHMRDIWLKDSRGETWTHYWKTADVYSRIDYILVSPGLAKEVIWRKCGIHDAPYWNEASDHRAIYAVINAADK